MEDFVDLDIEIVRVLLGSCSHPVIREDHLMDETTNPESAREKFRHRAAVGRITPRRNLTIAQSQLSGLLDFFYVV